MILPLLWTAYALSPLCHSKGTRARKTWYHAWVPTEGLGGNNPASQYVHEVGGFRFGALLSVPVQLMIGAALWWFSLAPLYAPLVQWLAILLMFAATRRWIDIGEHAAEVLHAEAAGIEGYREAEIARMTRPGAEYHGKPFGEMMTKARFRAWAIGKLGAW